MLPAVTTGRELAGVGLFLLACLLVFFHRALAPGQALSPADLIFATPFFQAQAPPGCTHPSNPLLVDQVYQFAPWRHFADAALRQGHLPLWNPDSLCGSPFLATLQSAVFFPINVLTALLPFSETFLVSALLRLWTAGFFTYALVRRYGLGRASALISAVSFMLCGFLIVWLGHPHTNVVIWLPALILLTENLVGATAGHRARWAALLALVIGVQFLGGHIESSVDVLTTVVLYFALRLWQTHRARPGAVVTPTILLAGSIGLGTLLAAVQLLPFLEWLPLSTPFHDRSPHGFRWVDIACWRQILTLPALAFPNIYGNPTWADGRPSGLLFLFLKYGNYNEQILYVGILTLILAVIGVIHRRREPWVQVWTLLGIIGLGRAFGLPMFDWLNQLPGLSLENAGRLRLIFAFSLCALAGFGAQTLWEEVPHARHHARDLWVRLCGLVAGAGALMAALGLGLILLRHLRPNALHSHLVHSVLPSLLAPTNVALYVPAWIALVGLVTARFLGDRPDRLPMVKVALVCLVLMDLVAFGQDYNPTVPTLSLYPATPAVAALAGDPGEGRVTALGQTLIPEAQMLFGLADVRGMDFTTRWYGEYMALVPGYAPMNNYSVLLSSADSPLVRVLNVKDVVSDPTQAAPSGTTVAWRGAGVTISRLIHVQPRSFLVTQSSVARDDAQATQWLRADPASVYTRAILCPDATGGTAPTATTGVADSASSVTPVRDAPEDAAWTVVSAHGGCLVTTDAYYPGWEATVDGYPTPIRRADLAFRAVSVPPGVHVVAYHYRPKSVFYGIRISLFALAVIGACLAQGMYQKSKRNTEASA